MSWLVLETNVNETYINAAKKLGYDEYSWDNYGVNELEGLGWKDLEEGEREMASILGFDERSW